MRAQPLVAAEDVAAWLAERLGFGSMIVVTPDATLDAAIHGTRLPTTGAAPTAVGACEAALQILRLGLELVSDPPHQRVALELLSLPSSRIPRGLARKLAAAPRVACDRKRLVERMHSARTTTGRIRTRSLDGSTASTWCSRGRSRDRDAIPTAIVRKRIDPVATWVRACMHADVSTRASGWTRASCSTVLASGCSMPSIANEIG